MRYCAQIKGRDTDRIGDPPPEQQIVEHIAVSGVLEAAANLGEVGLDGAIEFGREIPVLGTLVVLGRLGAGIRDHLFARKLVRFYAELATTSEPDRIAFVEAIRRAGQLDRAGETLLEVLDKAITTEKAMLIGKLYAHCVQHEGSTAAS